MKFLLKTDSHLLLNTLCSRADSHMLKVDKTAVVTIKCPKPPLLFEGILLTFLTVTYNYLFL